MNKVILKGRLTKDPEVRYGGDANQTCFARWSLAVEDRTWKEEDGKCHVDFIPCKAIGKAAEIAEQHLSKGKEILLFGKMQSGKYEKDGKTIFTLEMFVQEIEFCGKKEGYGPSYEGDFMSIPDGIEDELPFH